MLADHSIRERGTLFGFLVLGGVELDHWHAVRVLSGTPWRNNGRENIGDNCGPAIVTAVREAAIMIPRAAQNADVYVFW
jgi:hypothetical protein